MASSDDSKRPGDTDPAISSPRRPAAALRAPAEPGLAIADTDASEPGAEDASRLKGRGPRAVRPGDVLGRYELGEELGEGGMATVFRARDKELRRDVAVKVLFPHLARRPDIVRRFHREARAAAGLEHANILRIYDVGGGEDEDPPFIVMELIRGRTLLQEIEQRGAMFTEVVACMGALLADALAAAHAAQIVHRDIKPANVLIASGGRLLLADFGVARLETEDSLVTKTGALLGTPAYMSPEQASGDTATAKSDLYSLGATMYQLATGSLAFSGNAAKVIAQIMSGQLVAPAKKRPAVGPDLSQIIVRLMATEPEQRIASAAAVASELRALLSAAGFGDPTEELAAYFAEPDAFVRERTPRVVLATVASARAALADGKLPRAMALADRASALAPGDPAVTTLIEKVAEGGRATTRRKALALGGLGLALAGGGTALAFSLSGGAPAVTPSDAGTLALVDDAAVDAEAGPSLLDASNDMPVDAPNLVDAQVVVDAQLVRTRVDAGTARRDADVAVAVVAIDAAEVVVPIDAAPAPAAPGAILVRNDVYCDVTIDGVAMGRVTPASAKPFPVEAGAHTVTCGQLGLDAWTKQVQVRPGETSTVTGSLLQTFDVSLAVGVTIDGVPHAAGGVLKLKKNRYRVEAGGKTKYLTINGPCQLRSSPDLDCYR
ncbi:MAG: serine/threonine-protein kinase [Kofleriaceae bacterium]|nr:serine/threonine-protein kinase [Kofleriaceae bacterium]